MIVQKYGGSSLATMEKMRHVAEKISRAKERHGHVVVVVSAMGQTTNNLIKMAKSAVKSPTKRELDMLLSTGEQVSTSLLSMMLNESSHPAVSLNGFQAGIQTEGLYTKNRIKDIDISRIRRYLDENHIVVITGFQGYNPAGDITTLGRGGSDTTAVAIAAKFGCDCEIYTDVDGICTMDPRRYPQAKKLKEISYEEMCELSYLGARVMEGRAVEIAQKYNVNVRVANAHTDGNGSWIKETPPMMEQKYITGISVTEDIVMMSLHRIQNSEKGVSELFSALAEKEVNVDMISQTPLDDGTVSLAFTAPQEDIEILRETVNELRKSYAISRIEEDSELSKVSLVGIGMRSQSGVAASIFKLLASLGIPFKLITTSDISISYTIPKNHTDEAVRVLAERFNL